jgi:hypothetical protein
MCIQALSNAAAVDAGYAMMHVSPVINDKIIAKGSLIMAARGCTAERCGR